MKNLKIAALAALAAVLVTAAVGIGAFAETSSVTAEIGSANIAYNEKTHVALTVNVSGTLAEGETVGLAFWDDTVTDALSAENATYVTYDTYTSGGVTYYKSMGFNSIEMAKVFRTAPVLCGADGTEIIGTVIEYSVVKYAISRLDDNGLTDEQLELYYDLILYGNDAEKILGDGVSKMALVYTENGYVNSGNNALYDDTAADLERGYIKSRGICMGGDLGEKALLRAEAKNADGKYFIRWEDSRGNTVSNERLCYVDVVGGGIQKYTAVYGVKGNSLYKNVIDFESHACGSLIDYDGTFYTQDNGSQTTNRTVTIGGMTTKFDYGAMPTYAEDGTTITGIDDSTLTYYDIVETADGDKELRAFKDNFHYGITTTFITNVDNAQAFELDVTYEELTRTGGFYGVIIEVSDGTTSKNIRTNISMQADGFNLSVNNVKDRFLKADGSDETAYYYTNVGETITIKAALETYTETVDGTDTLKAKVVFYVNGKYFATSTFDNYYYVNEAGKGYGIDLSGLDVSNLKITSGKYLTTMAEDGIMRFDNIIFYK